MPLFSPSFFVSFSLRKVIDKILIDFLCDIVGGSMPDQVGRVLNGTVQILQKKGLTLGGEDKVQVRATSN